MMIDFSGNKLSEDNIEDFYLKVKQTSNKQINNIWLGVQDYSLVFDLQKKIHNDRINDTFFIQGVNNQYGLVVLNRWGQTVFNQNPYLNNWDGRTTSGLELPNGTYYYVLTNYLENEKSTGIFQLTR